MTRSSSWVLASFALGVILQCGCAAQPSPEAAAADAPVSAPEPVFDPESYGQEMTRLLFEGNDEEIWRRFSPKMKAAMKSMATWAQTRQSVVEQLGAETEVLREDSVNNVAVRLYWRLARFEKVPVPIHVMWTFESDESVGGFSVKPEQKEAETRFLEYSPKTELRLPFAGEWYVFWGGRDVIQNYHAAAKDQRFAYDFLAVEGGSTHRGDGSRNSDYHCYERPIFAPGPGVVFEAGDGVAENLPGQKNSKQLLGNYVILDHENGEYSFFAHLKTGTVAVSKGDRVEAGTLLGECGNSGHSTEPHLHYHLQNTPKLFKGEGLPVFFHGYTADGTPVERGEPIQGQQIASESD